MAETAPTFTRERPNPLLKLGFVIPPKIYYGPIASFLSSRCVMKLTTTGRTSGKPRMISISYHPLNGGYFGLSGFGIESNWYKNIKANPEVTIQVGRKTMQATARIVEDPERRRYLIMKIRDRSSGCGPPTFIRPLLRLTRIFDYDAEVQMAVDRAEEMPVVEFEVK